jgi:hypothetical protein
VLFQTFYIFLLKLNLVVGLMNYLKEFHPVSSSKNEKTHFIENMQNTVNQIRRVLDDLHTGEIPNKNFSKTELTNLCTSFVKGQRYDISRFEGSWAVIPEQDDEGMPADARVDFVFMPTYLVVSILTKVMTDFSENITAIPRYVESLKEGYKFATLRGLTGHGYESMDVIIEVIELFEKGRVLTFLSENPEFSPEMYGLLKKIKTEMELKLKKGDVTDAWGEEYSNKYLKTVERLQAFN